MKITVTGIGEISPETLSENGQELVTALQAEFAPGSKINTDTAREFVEGYMAEHCLVQPITLAADGPINEWLMNLTTEVLVDSAFPGTKQYFEGEIGIDFQTFYVLGQ